MTRGTGPRARTGSTLDGVVMLSVIAIAALLVAVGISLGSDDAGGGAAATATTLAPPSTARVPVAGTPDGAQVNEPIPDVRTDVTGVGGVVYRTVGDIRLKADVYLPPTAAANGATVVLVHGGGWIGGDRDEFVAEGRELAARGFVAVAIDYRLAPEHRYPAPLDDVRGALDWLSEPDTIERFGIDPSRIGMLGASAGGHLATMLGLADPRVGAVVSWSGIYDLRTFLIDDSLLGCVPTDCPEIAAAASPISYVGPDAAPMLLVSFTDDPIVPASDTAAFVAALQAADAEHQTIEVGDTGHADTVRDRAIASSATYLADRLTDGA